MAMTPVEIHHIRLSRGPLGYRRRAVDGLLEEIVESFEAVWRERADLADKVEQLESDLVRYRELETLLRTTLISAERAAHELRDQAKREAELIVDEAHAEAREIMRNARGENESLLSETRRARALLRSALAALDEAARAGGEGGEDETPQSEAA